MTMKVSAPRTIEIARSEDVCSTLLQLKVVVRRAPRLPLEGKLSASRLTDEVCRKMLRFEGVSGEFVTFSTSSDRPSGGHLEVNCPEGAREAALGRPLKGKALGCAQTWKCKDLDVATYYGNA